MNYFVRLLTAVALSANCIADEHSGPLVVPIRLVDNLAVVQATINERSVSLDIDSGGHSAIALKPGIVSSNATVDGEGTKRYVGADGTVREARRFSVDDVRIAGLPAAELRGSEMIGGPSGVDGYLGYGWLSQYIAVFDYAGGQLRLYEAGQPIPDSECSGPGWRSRSTVTLSRRHWKPSMALSQWHGTSGHQRTCSAERPQVPVAAEESGLGVLAACRT